MAPKTKYLETDCSNSDKNEKGIINLKVIKNEDELLPSIEKILSLKGFRIYKGITNSLKSISEGYLTSKNSSMLQDIAKEMTGHYEYIMRVKRMAQEKYLKEPNGSKTKEYIQKLENLLKTNPNKELIYQKIMCEPEQYSNKELKYLFDKFKTGLDFYSSKEAYWYPKNFLLIPRKPKFTEVINNYTKKVAKQLHPQEIAKSSLKFSHDILETIGAYTLNFFDTKYDIKEYWKKKGKE